MTRSTRTELFDATEALRLAAREAQRAVQAIQRALEALPTTQQLPPGRIGGETAAQAAKEIET